MNVVALITWFSAGRGLLPLAARLIEYTSDFQGAGATRLPMPVIFAGPAATASSVTAQCGLGAVT